LKEEDMQLYAFSARHMKLFAVVLFVAFAVSGCRKVPLTTTCGTSGNVIIKVDHTKPKGVDHKAVYVCTNYTITWERQANVQSFEVHFVGVDPSDFPFGPANANFGTGNATTPPLPDPKELTVFKYNLKIVDSNGISHPFDPHVVGGGGL
jgi:hypothetical protein